MAEFRHEYKHDLTTAAHLALRARLRAVLQPDPHAVNGAYVIRSLYFDNLADKALREKLDGVDRREKFRIRLYNNDLSYIRLEKKTKRNGLGSKTQAPLTPQEVHALLQGDLAWMPQSGRPLVVELYAKMRGQGLAPKTIVEYTREPFVYGPGNVRVTLDSNIRTGLRCTDLLDPACVTVPAPGAPVALLEVKWDAYLPDVIRQVVQMPGLRAAAFSKYAVCRMYD